MPATRTASPSSLRSLILRLAGTPQARTDVAALVTACHRMAVAYLRVKSASGHFSPARFGLRLEDLALDGIADLFARDAEGTHPVIRALAARIAPGDPTDVTVEHELRRFVCSLVNRRIFDLYRQFDPSLARVIRNIKLAAFTHPDIALTEHLGEKVLVPRGLDDLAPGLPVIAPELLHAELLVRVSHPRSLGRCLSMLAATLRELGPYRRMLPLTQAALALRAILFPGDAPTSGAADPSDLSEAEVRALVDRTLHSLRTGMGSAYLHRGKLTAAELEAHIAAARDVLLREFNEPETDHACFFEFLRRHLPDLDRTGYSERHRSILEYVVRSAKSTLAGEVLAGF
jgi:hypothetical protein